MTNQVKVSIPEVKGKELIGTVSASGSVSRFFSGEPFRTKFSTNIEGIPKSIRPIPILAQVCPVAWAVGADVTVETADAVFLNSIREIRSTFLEMYPEFMEGGTIHCPNPVQRDVDPEKWDSSGMLFTGGVDSTATYVRHRSEDPTLVMIRGWIIGLDEDDKWAKTKDYVNSFGEERNCDGAFVESNMLNFLNMPLLQAHFERYLEGAWYSAVGHGLGLLGLCAPMAYAQRWNSLYIAASHTPEWPRPWGSHPAIDNNVVWTGTQCSHDGFNLSRQDKIERIAQYVESESKNIPIRTCIYDDGSGNCSECEKCYRTIVGLLLAGLNPNDHGYKCDGETLSLIQNQFEKDEWNIKSHTCFHWEVLQEAAMGSSIDIQNGGSEFLRWFKNHNFQKHVATSDPSLKRKGLQFIGRNTPTRLYWYLYPLYQNVAKRGR